MSQVDVCMACVVSGFAVFHRGLGRVRCHAGRDWSANSHGFEAGVNFVSESACINVLFYVFSWIASRDRTSLFTVGFFSGYWRQRADERLGDPPPPRWIQEPLVVRDRDGRPQEDPLAVHCFCVCSGSTLLGDLLGVSMIQGT